MSKEISTTPCMWSGTINHCELWWYTGLEAQIFFKSSWHFLKMNRLKFSFNGLSKSHIIEHTILPLVTKSLSKFHDTWFLTSIMWDSPMRFIFSWMPKRSINDKKTKIIQKCGASWSFLIKKSIYCALNCGSRRYKENTWINVLLT